MRGVMSGLEYKFVTIDLKEEPKCKGSYGLPDEEVEGIALFHHSTLPPSMELQTEAG